MRAVRILACLAALSFRTVSAPDAPGIGTKMGSKPFSHKLIFSETPESPPKWHGGFRITDLTLHEAYINLGGILTADLFVGWIPQGILAALTQDTARDNFLIFTLKSRPFSLNLPSVPMSVAGGAKYYATHYKIPLLTEDGGQVTLADGDTALSLFAAQSTLLFSRVYCNLHTSMSLRSKALSDTTRRTTVSWYLVPGVRVYPGRKRCFSVAVEYYYMNPEKMPLMLKELFWNIDKHWISWMFWGTSWQLRHFRIDLNFTNHPSFQGPKGDIFVIPAIGVGYSF